MLNLKLKKKKKKLGPADALQEPSLALQILNRYLIWALLLIVAIGLLVGYVFVLSEQISETFDAAQESLPAKQKVLSDLQAIQIDLDNVVRDFDTIRASKSDDLDRLDLLLPQSSAYGDLFAHVDELTRQSGLTLLSLNIAFSGGGGDENPRFQQVGSADDFAESPLPDVQSMTLNFSVEGDAEAGSDSYETFKNYLEDLENNIRLFDVQSVSFVGSTLSVVEDEVEGAATGVQFDIDLVTYYQENEQ